MILLDTDHISIIQRRTQPEFGRLEERLLHPTPLEYFVSVVSFHEQMLGWNVYLKRARDAKGVVRAFRMFEGLISDYGTQNVLPLDEDAANKFEELRHGRVRIATTDLRIASIALVRGLKLLSRNLVDFRKVPGLDVEDWTVA